MSAEMGRLIGERLGKVIAVKADEEGRGLGACLAVRIEIDIRKPLKRRLKVTIEGDRVVFVDFKYERLLALCYCCGIIGHNDSDCETAVRMRKEGVLNPAQYGKWIRAPVRQKFSKENASRGGKEGSTKQSSATERREDWSRRNVSSREVELREEDRDNMVITVAAKGEEERTKSRLSFLCQSSSAHGEGKEPVHQTETPPSDGGENQKSTDAIIWLKSDGEDQQLKAGKSDNGEKGMGCIQAHSSTKNEGKSADFVQYQAHNERTKAKKGEDVSIGKNENQTKWKRVARADGKEKEITQQTEQLKNGKRRGSDVERSQEGEEKQEKKLKVGVEGETNLMAVAGEQPRRIQ